MKFGISTACFYPLKTEDALLEICKTGACESEIFFNAESELSGEILEKLCRIKDEYSVNIGAVHPFTSGFEPFLLFSAYKRRFRDGLDFYKKYAYAAARLSAKYIIIHGDLAAGAISETEYFERFAELREVCAGYGAEPIQENVNKFRGASPDFISRMRKALPEVKFCYDLKQCVRSDCDPAAVLAEMGEGLSHIHLSDHSPAGTCLLPGKGEFDFKELFRILTAADYKGACLLEVYRSAFKNSDELIQSLNKLKQDYISL